MTNTFNIIFVENDLKVGKEVKKSELYRLPTIPVPESYIQWKDKLFRVVSVAHEVENKPGGSFVSYLYIEEVIIDSTKLGKEKKI